MFLKRLFPRTLFSLTPSSFPSPYSIFIAQCSSSSPSHLTYPHSHSHPDPRNVRVSVWWDLDNCNVPSGVNVFRGAQAITAAIRSSGFKGPIDIKSFGDMLRLARADKEALSSSGINLTHIPHDGNDSAHRSLFRGLTCWVSRNPPPGHLFLIIADEGCASMLHFLKKKNYNILLASKKPIPSVLGTAATMMWNWEALVRGENLTGRYFNRPPKCPWYDYYQGPLWDPHIAFEFPEDPLDIFSQDSFWIDLQIFFSTDIGSFIINELTTSEQMACHLQKYGPSVLKSLSESDILLMLDILMSEKSWVLEYP